MNFFKSNNPPIPNTPFSNIMALVVVLAGLAWAVFSGFSLLKSAAARQWPTTVGSVVDSRIVRLDYGGGSPGSRWVNRAVVRYRYEVDGHAFESTNLKFGLSQLGGAYKVYPPETAQRYPVGASLPVSYQPGNPANAVSDTASAGSDYLKLIGGVCLFCAGLGYLLSHPIKIAAAASPSASASTSPAKA